MIRVVLKQLEEGFIFQKQKSSHFATIGDRFYGLELPNGSKFGLNINHTFSDEPWASKEVKINELLFRSIRYWSKPKIKNWLHHIFYALYAHLAGIVWKRFARQKKWHKLLFSISKINKVRAGQWILYNNHFIHELS